MKMFSMLKRSTRAATAVEYGLILALLFLAASVAMSNVGASTNVMWNTVSSETTGVM